MKKLLCLFLILLFFDTLSLAQTWRRVGGWGNELTGISWVNDEVGYVCGDHVILKTIDGGLSWIEQSSPTKNKMHGVDFFNENTGLIVGEKGQVYRTENAGNSWELIILGTTQTLRRVKFLNRSKAHIVGDNGQMYRSTNGGESWQKQDIETTTDLTSMTFANIDTGYVATSSGIILRTINQGESWTPQSTQNTQRLNDVYFTSSKIGYAVGHSGTILKTTDAGTHWQAVNSGTNRDLIGVAFNKSNINLGVVVGSNATLLRTNNGGVTFDGINVNNTQDYLSASFRANSNMVFAVGSNGYVLSSSNSGGSWVQRLAGVDSDYTATQFRNENLGYIVGAVGKFLVTSNGGNTINDRSRPLTIDFNNLFFTTNAFGFIIGDKGTALRTSNSGTNWTSLNLITDRDLNGIYFFNNNIGYVVGENGFISKTENAGVNWQTVQASNTTIDLNEILFFDDVVGVVVGDGGFLARSEGGQEWEKINVPTNEDLVDVTLLDATTAVAIGNEGTILKTIDKGLNWDKISTSFTMDFSGIDFLDESVGFICGAKGLILRTLDGGATWEKLETGTFQDFTDLSFGSLSIGYAVGERGTLFQYSCAVPPTPTLIFGEDNICLSQQIYSVQTTGVGEVFDWRVDGGIILEGQSSHRIVVRWDKPGRNAVLVRAQNECGNGGTKGLEVLVSVEPQSILEINGEGVVCTGSLATYSVNDVAGTEFVWQASGGLIKEGQGTAKASVEWTGIGAQNLTVTPRNPCGNGTRYTKLIQIQNPPKQPSDIEGSNMVGLVAHDYQIANVPNTNYIWSVSGNGGTIMDGQGTNKVRVRWIREGNFDLTVTPMNSCNIGLATTLLVNVNLITSIEEEKNPNINIQAYPNPSKGNITLSTLGLSGLREISIINSLGQELQHVKPSQGVFEYRVLGLPRGVHTIILRTREGEFFKKIIVE